MTTHLPFARITRAIIVLAVITTAGTAWTAGSPADQMTLPVAAEMTADVSAGLSSIHLAPLPADKAGEPAQRSRSVLVALPRSADSFELSFTGSGSGRISAPEGIMSLRGQPVVRVMLEDVDPGPLTVTVAHNGDWSTDRALATEARLLSPGLAAALEPTLPATAMRSAGGGGSYVIVYAPAFGAAIEPLVEWKTRKGFNVVTVSTSITGASSSGIKAWLQDAYDTGEVPPEYVLLVGDVDEIPTYSFHGNPSDFPYILLDGDDWLPDGMVGRLPVENDTEARTLVNKIVSYERQPYTDDTAWYTKSLMVAGLTGSTTPPHTVQFCGEQLESIGYDPATAITSPHPIPPQMGATMIRQSIDAGTSFVIYRGWAYGTAGWDPPTYTVTDIPALSNGYMLPVVMSFVCLTGDYSYSSPCFGEVFVRQGTPENPGKGAVAFIGNGEHWSHTRYNDAMAIAFFERITDPSIQTLGSLMTAGKLRFMDYFPHEMSAEEYGEESVEFYFHIYNLLGDPELNYWTAAPVGIDVTHAANLAVGTNTLAVSVQHSSDASAVTGARVGVVQNGLLIGHGTTAADGSVQVALTTPVVTGSDVELTVTGANLHPYEATLVTGTNAVFVAVTGITVDDGQSAGSGNGDGVANPGEVLSVIPEMTNSGANNSGAFSAAITSLTGPATVTGGSADFAAIAGGSSGQATTPLGISINADAAGGQVITCLVDATRSGDQHDLSVFEIVVSAPDLMVVSLAPEGADAAAPGTTVQLAVTLESLGDIATAGGSATLELLTAGGADLTATTASFGPCEPGATVVSSTDFELQIDGDTATGTNLSFLLTLETSEGYESEATVALVVGPVDVTTPFGPDAYGYYAYDSADLDYPASRPDYFWHEIADTLGGPGTKLSFPVDNLIVNRFVDLPFSFRYYGEDFDQIRVSDNGWISFHTDTYYNFYNWPMPSVHGNDAVVAPFWDNLNPEIMDEEDENPNGVNPDGIFTYYDAAAGTFTVEWSRLPHYKPEILGFQSFQVVLLDPTMHSTASGDGEILFLYRQVTNNDHLRMYSTVGMESPDGMDGLQLSYANINAPGMAPLQAGLAIRLTTEPPVRVPFAVSAFTADAGDHAVRLQWQPADERPVLGWHVDRVTATGRERLTDSPLPGPTRERTFAVEASSDTEDVRYVLTALHPYGATSKAGETRLAGTTGLHLALYPARPNPAPGQTTIGFALPRTGTVRLRIYDVAGRLVRTLVDGPADAGPGIRVWDGKDDGGTPAAGGVYFYRLENAGSTLTRKLILVR